MYYNIWKPSRLVSCRRKVVLMWSGWRTRTDSSPTMGSQVVLTAAQPSDPMSY